MTFPDNEMKKLGRSTQINIHNTESLIRALKYVSDILQREEAFTVEEHKHTYTYTHTHTHANTNTKSTWGHESLGQSKDTFVFGYSALGHLVHFI